MSFDFPKWYQVDISAPYEVPEEQSNLVRSRDQLPEWLDIQGRKWGESTKDIRRRAVFSFRDFPEWRRILVKTADCEQIAEVAAIPTVTVTPCDPTGFWIVVGRIMTEEEFDNHACDDEHRKIAASRYYSEIWPRSKRDVQDIVSQHHSSSVVKVVDSDKAKAIFLKTSSYDMLDEILSLGHTEVEELPPGEGMETILEICRKWENA